MCQGIHWGFPQTPVETKSMKMTMQKMSIAALFTVIKLINLNKQQEGIK